MKLAEYRDVIRQAEAAGRTCEGDRRGLDYCLATLEGVAREIRDALWKPDYRDEAREVAALADAAAEKLYPILDRQCGIT